MWKPMRCARGRYTVATLVGLVVLGLLSPAPATAEVYVEETPRRAWGVDGRVYATAIADNVLVVGGQFSNAIAPNGQRVPRANLAAFDVRTGDLLTGWRVNANRNVRVLHAEGDQVYVGGGFTQLNGVTRRRFARIDADTGAIDPAVNLNISSTVRAIATNATSIYIGGTFTQVNQVNRARVARLRKSPVRLDTGFAANANDAVFGLAISPVAPTLYVAGRFGAISGAGRNGVAAVNATTGAIRSGTFANSVRPTLGLAINDDGTRLYGAGGSGTNTMAAWNTANGNRVWRHVAMGDVQAVVHFRDTVYFSFHEGFQGDTTVKTLAADAATGTLDAAFRPDVNSFMGVFAIAAGDHGVAIGGDFTRVSGITAHRVAFFPASNPPEDLVGDDPQEPPAEEPPLDECTTSGDGGVFVEDTPRRAWGVDGRVHATAIAGNAIVVGGNFDNAVGPDGQRVPRSNLAAFDLDSGDLLTGWRVDANRNVRVLHTEGDHVYVGGGFTELNGVTRRRFARVHADTGAIDPAVRINVNGTVRAIATDATSIYLGGIFRRVSGVTRDRVARLHKSSVSLDTGFAAHANDAVFGLAVHPTAPTVYVAGRFSVISGTARNGVAAVHAATGSARSMTFANSARPTLDLATNADGSQLFGAGAGNNAAAAWNTANGARQWRHVAMGDIQAVAHHGDTVYFAFHEGFRADTTLKTLAADAATGVLDAEFRPAVNSFMGVFDIATSDHGIAIGGDFTRVSGTAADHLAFFPASTPPTGC